MWSLSPNLNAEEDHIARDNMGQDLRGLRLIQKTDDPEYLNLGSYGCLVYKCVVQYK